MNRALVVIVAGSVMVMLSMGTRHAFGIAQIPITLDLGTGREVFSLAMAWQNIFFGIPIAGILADRFGARTMAVGGGILYAIGILLASMTTTGTMLYITLGVIIGLALSGTTYVVVLSAVAQVVPAERRTSTFGFITAAGSFGTFALVPLIQWLVTSFGWRTAFVMISGLVGVMVLLALTFPGKTKDGSQKAKDDGSGTMLEVLKKARSHSGYLLLIAGFFVCGFHVSFIGAHLPAFLADKAIAPGIATLAFSLIGLFNIFGSSLFGFMGDYYRKKYLLSFLYFARSIVIALFIFIIPLTSTTALIFGCAIGFLWLATVPLTSGTVAQIFGARYLATLYGIVFFSHQVGSFLGVWLGGRLYDTTGSYDVVWYMGIALGIFAALVHLPITDSPVKIREEVAAATPA